MRDEVLLAKSLNTWRTYWLRNNFCQPISMREMLRECQSHIQETLLYSTSLSYCMFRPPILSLLSYQSHAPLCYSTHAILHQDVWMLNIHWCHISIEFDMFHLDSVPGQTNLRSETFSFTKNLASEFGYVFLVSQFLPTGRRDKSTTQALPKWQITKKSCLQWQWKLNCIGNAFWYTIKLKKHFLLNCASTMLHNRACCSISWVTGWFLPTHGKEYRRQCCELKKSMVIGC